MTTIVSNGYYMLADKRTTFTSSAIHHPELTSGYEGFKFSRPSRRYHNDEVTKLVPEPPTTYGKKKVVAIAGSGDVDMINELLSYLEHMTVEEMVKVKARSSRASGYVQLLFITEDFHTHRISFSKGDGAISERSYRPGSLAATGSGGVMLMEFQDRMQHRVEKTHILNLFLLASNTDPASSNCFDVYGAQEKKYFCNIIPTPEEVTACVRQATSLLDFASYRKQHHFTSKKTT